MAAGAMSDDTTLTPSRFASERFLCVVLHDVAPSTRAACMRALAAVAAVAEAPVTLLAVPRYHGETATPELVEWLGARRHRGDELALHGWSHRDEQAPAGTIDRLRRRVYTRGEGEFWALSEREATRRIEAGVAWFGEHGWPLAGFVAPAWLLGPGAWQALATQRFEYTATLRELVHLPGRARVKSQSVVYSTSSAWRRQSSLAWNAAVARLERGNRLLRLELHPRDADFAPVRRSWQRVLERALRDRRAVTVADFMRHDRAAAPTVVPEAAVAPSTQWQSTSAE
jgi:predicted deacetylase